MSNQKAATGAAV